MEDKELIQKTEELVSELMEKLDIPATIEVDVLEGDDDKRYVDVNLEAGESGALLIGYHGNRLDAIATVLNMMMAQAGEKCSVLVDANGYRKERASYIKELTRRTLEEVIATNEEIALNPMKPWERRVVHVTLAERTDVQTRSEGEGENRRVIIEPVGVI